MIKDVELKELKLISDERGVLMEILRADDDIFKGFGQCYISVCNKGAVKGWHYHKEQIDNFVCMSGKALVVLYDFRENSPTSKEVTTFILEEPSNGSKPILLQIPPMIVHGFTAIDCEKTIILNVTNKPYKYESPDEYRLPWNGQEIPYKWPDIVKTGG